MAVTLFIAVVVLLALGFPVAFALAISAALAALAVQGATRICLVFKELFTGIDSFPLMAIPFFLLAAELMTGGALAHVLRRFAAMFVGHRRGGLGHTNVLTITFFSGISGSALADAAGPGAILVQMMRKSGYPRAYAAALTAAASIVGPIIPPSIIMIIYALQDQRVSVLALFWAGVIPGLMISIAMAGRQLAWISRAEQLLAASRAPTLARDRRHQRQGPAGPAPHRADRGRHPQRRLHPDRGVGGGGLLCPGGRALGLRHADLGHGAGHPHRARRC